jgi:hypothetical protein
MATKAKAKMKQLADYFRSKDATAKDARKIMFLFVWGDMNPWGVVEPELSTPTREAFLTWFLDNAKPVEGPFPSQLPKGHGLKVPRAGVKACWHNAGQLTAENFGNGVECWDGIAVSDIGVVTSHAWNKVSGQWLDRSWKKTGAAYYGIHVPDHLFFKIVGALGSWRSMAWHVFAFETGVLK